MKKAYVFLANGFEDVEAISPIDYLRRAGVQVELVALEGKQAVSSHGVTVLCDVSIQELPLDVLPDLVVLPGGMKGSEALASSQMLKDLVLKMAQLDRYIAAICASPAVVLGPWGLLNGKNWTGYPGLGASYKPKTGKERVLVDKHLVTSRGAGCAEEFSLVVIGLLCGQEARFKVADAILAREP